MGAGLAVFDKRNLYAGGALTLNQNWFEFVDPYSGGPYSGIGGGDGTRDGDYEAARPARSARSTVCASSTREATSSFRKMLRR